MAKIIYLISLLHNIDVLMNIIFTWLVVVTLWLCWDYFFDNGECKILERVKGKYKKLYIVLLIISMLGIVFIPSEKTMYNMLITEKVLTKENYNMTVNEAKRLIDYTVEKIEKTKEE